MIGDRKDEMRVKSNIELLALLCGLPDTYNLAHEIMTSRRPEKEIDAGFELLRRNRKRNDYVVGGSGQITEIYCFPGHRQIIMIEMDAPDARAVYLRHLGQTGFNRGVLLGPVCILDHPSSEPWTREDIDAHHAAVVEALALFNLIEGDKTAIRHEGGSTYLCSVVCNQGNGTVTINCGVELPMLAAVKSNKFALVRNKETTIPVALEPDDTDPEQVVISRSHC